MKEKILPADNFFVINKTILNDCDRKILIMLYQPLIGQTAISLYFSLWSYLDKTETISLDWTHHHLMTNMQIGLNEIIEAREKLEAVGLIRTYLKKLEISSYIYELYSPLSASEFLNNPVLDISLYNSIGKVEYEKIVNYFKVPKINLDDYKDISCSFNEIFASVDLEDYEPLLDDLKKSRKGKFKILSSFDVDNVLSNIPEEILSPLSITNDIKDLLYKLSFIYNYSDEQMEDMIINSIENKKINKNTLKTKCRNNYKFEHSSKVPKIVYRNQPEVLRKQNMGSTKKDKMIYQFETTSPYDYICSKHSGEKPTTQEINILEYLLIDMNLNPGVVNVIIDYVLKESNNKLIKSFVEVVATQFSRSKIETVEDAMILAEKEHKNKQRVITKKVIKKEEKKPEWFDKNLDSKEASKEKYEAMEKMLKKFE